VYWFWKNGNISREGITADLEAMHRVGIGGVIMMEVALSVPQGPVPFFSERWRELFGHAAAEADRLGLKISMNSAPGWTGSGGAWVTPERSMQKVVASETEVSGPGRVDQVLTQPETLHGFYRDIAVLAFPTPEGDYRIADIREKALYERGPFSSRPGVRPAFAAVAVYETVPPEQRILMHKIVDLTARMDASGRLVWDVPDGRWTILRFGHTSTGQTNRPAPSPGLECDKLDKEALDGHFRQFTAQLLADVGPRAGQTLVATHLDSWEVGGQNWTGRFRDEFQRRRGYDPILYLPVMTGRVVESLEVSERFLWDLRQTVSEMIAENHGRHMRELAHRHGMWLSIEAYDMTPCDDMTLGETADVPMCEFWSNTFDTRYSVKEATSVGHVYGKPVVAAEAFTSTESWLLHPGSVKALGDWAFSEGVNRFVIHRYVHQPFRKIRPGLSLGPHGVHYERTQTWWELSRPWHEYLARCQYLLQQGRWIADVLYLSPEGAPNVFQAPEPAPKGYKFDACTPDALLTRVSVSQGALVLPDGSKYRLLVLPDAQAMTPTLLRKIKQVVEAGATVVGGPPKKSPSLSGYPHCDEEVEQLAGALWGAGEGSGFGVQGSGRWTAPGLEDLNRPGRASGKGRIVWGSGFKRPRPRVEDAGRRLTQARWIWHREGNPAASAPVGKRYFRRTLKLEEGVEIEWARAFMTADNAFELWINGGKAGEGNNFHTFYSIDVTRPIRPGVNVLAVMADNGGNSSNPAALVGTLVVRYRDGREAVFATDQQWQTTKEAGRDWATNTESPGWSPAMELGRLGMAPWGNPSMPVEKHEIYPPSKAIVALLGRLRVPPDFVAAVHSGAADASQFERHPSRVRASAGRPAITDDARPNSPLRYAHRETDGTDVYFVSNGTVRLVQAACMFRVKDKAPELWHPETGRIRPLPQYSSTEDGRTVVPLRFEPAESYFVVFRPSPGNVRSQPNRSAHGKNFLEFKPLTDINGPWQVAFEPRWGGPEQPVTFKRLEDWSKSLDTRIKFYSGSATYTNTTNVPAQTIARGRRLYLDLGRVEVMAAVELNGKDLGALWKPPFRVEITDAVRAGPNTLVIKVVNLWPNRMIGDQRLPEDSERRANGTLLRWPQWLLEGKPSPTGRYAFASWKHWSADSPLLESGLLGPVAMLVENSENGH
jgi:hypothetical protein